MKVDFTREITNVEVDELIAKYPETARMEFPSLVREYRLDPFSSKLLYAFVREYQPTTVVEFGTSWGGSGRAIVEALVANEKPFTYTGFEIGEEMQRTAYDNISQLAPSSVQVHGDITKNLDKLPDSIDFAFIDPDQDIEITHWWLKNLLPRIKTGGLLQIHDWSVRVIDENYVYEGGSFAGIFFLIDVLKAGLLPVKKIFAEWDYETYREKHIAASFWIKI